MYEGDDLTNLEEETPPEESGNKTFLVWAGILGGIILLAIACVATYAFFYLPRQAAERDAAAATRMAQDVAVGLTLTSDAQVAMLSQTPQATATPTVTNTPVIQNATTTPISDPQTATVIAALTQAAQAQQTITALPTSTQLPATGFADESGATGLIVMTLALVVVILLARRLRSAPAK